MARTVGLVLRDELARSERPYPFQLRRRVVEYAQGAREGGAGVERIAMELGIAPQTLRSWLPSTVFRPVEIVAHEEPPRTDAIVVVDPRSGLRVEGLDVAAAAELVRRLR